MISYLGYANKCIYYCRRSAFDLIYNIGIYVNQKIQYYVLCGMQDSMGFAKGP